MIREAFCGKCRDEYAEVDAAGRCKVCGSKILETEKEFKKKHAAAKAKAAKAAKAK